MVETPPPKSEPHLVLPDQVHIDRLREALWSGAMLGRVAVMIGSGFSRNANPVKSETPQFPLWSELMERIVSELFSSDPSEDNTLQQQILRAAGTTSGALRLSEEYSSLHGRDRLDRLLKDQIPDNNYDPGDLHELFMRLPWADVFTTNWDTLLERAADGLRERRYDRVLRIEDIPQAIRPRIVKLHGSFPSIGPFILTEEDFRTYPRRFAPFVNLVQQSMMENLLCLIGFSGDDPNFLQWSGWVRDNMGEHTPYIYLCGLLNLRPGERRLLEQRRVTPVDLSPLFDDRSEMSRDRKHRLATEWFLRNLHNGRPPDPLDWPSSPRRPADDIPGLPPVPPYRGPQPSDEHPIPPS